MEAGGSEQGAVGHWIVGAGGTQGLNRLSSSPGVMQVEVATGPGPAVWKEEHR